MTTQPFKPEQRTLGQAVKNSASNVFNRTLGRLFGAGLNKGAEKGTFGGNPGSARWTTRSGSTDWRVKLTIPSNSSLRSMFFSGNGQGNTDYRILEPLDNAGGIVFPLTPTILMQHQAHYSQLATTHANYPYYAYQNSEASYFSIIGDFPVQNQSDAAYWVASIHFLRSVTKMFFGGDDATRGNPPPILKLNGYGNHVFKNVPVIVTNFTCDLRADVDYIATSQGVSIDARDLQRQRTQGLTLQYNSSIPETWAPTMSTINIQVQPVYSRDTVKKFSMSKFVRGELHNSGADGNTEGIGFI